MDASQHPEPRDTGVWAAKVDRLHVDDRASHYGYNIEGRRVAGPMQGFGRLWSRTYTVDLGTAAGPEEVVAQWRGRFGEFWPRTGRFHGSMSAIQPGDVAPLTASGVTTGIMVLYADDTSFSFLTPEGHMFAAMITFGAEVTADGTTAATIRILLRNSDPIFEMLWPISRRGEDVFWAGTLRNLAAALGAARAEVAERTECVDRRRLWRNWTNIRHNSAIHTVLHMLTAPIRRMAAR